MSPLNSVIDLLQPGEVIVLPENFEFDAARKFLRKIKNLPNSVWPSMIRIDCRLVREIDTAGLGTLLLLADHFGAKSTLCLEGAHGKVQSLLEIARIPQRFARAGMAALPPDLRACAECGNPQAGKCTATYEVARHCPNTRGVAGSPVIWHAAATQAA